jgi:cephalosporin-C deacetylase
MPLTDLPLEELQRYQPLLDEPSNFDEFWSDTLSLARKHPVGLVAKPETGSGLRTVTVQDVRFAGWDGQAVAAWLLLPTVGSRPFPTVVQYCGYTGGRGLPIDNLLFSAAGYAHLIVDSRGQGHDTPDGGHVEIGTQWVGGFMTRGIENPGAHYYRRLMTDCVRAVDAIAEHPDVDSNRIVVAGGSQGGGLALAAAGLLRDAVAAALIDVPFLCHYRRGADRATDGPYLEIRDYLAKLKPDNIEGVFRTLSYFDGVHLAGRAIAPALFSVGLMDEICPPSTVYAAYHRYAGRKEIVVWPFSGHSGGMSSQAARQLAWLEKFAVAPADWSAR